MDSHEHGPTATARTILGATLVALGAFAAPVAYAQSDAPEPVEAPVEPAAEADDDTGDEPLAERETES